MVNSEQFDQKPENPLSRARPVSSGNAERRQLTVMFCDLVNSVGLSRRLDPEDWQDIIVAYQKKSEHTINKHNGVILGHLGDGLFICFGYPVANEDDAERAIHAGLNLVDTIVRLNEELDQSSDLTLKVRIGIATGLVVVGEAVAAGAAGRDAVTGEAVNLASRLQGIANPNCVVVSAITRQLAAENFEYRDLGPQTLKGFDAPVPVYEVVGERQVSRLEARGTALTPFIGREAEIKTLVRCWQRALSGDGQVVILAGEAGIGKSRIAAELQNRIGRAGQSNEGDGVRPLVLQCSPYHANAPLYPVSRQVERLADISRLDSSTEKITKLEAMLRGRQTGLHEAIRRLGNLVGITAYETALESAESAAVSRHLTIEAVTDWCIRWAKASNAVIVFEDVQWIDPTTRLLLARLVSRAANTGIMIMISLRTAGGTEAESFMRESGIVAEDGRRPPHVTVFAVQELGEAEATRLAVAAAGKPIPPPQLATILAKSEGIPLFLEELTKAVNTGVRLSPAQAEDEQPVGIPNTIRDALMAQLDRLGQAKATAQHASVIGHEFSATMLVRITGKPINQLEPEIRLLIDSNIVLRNTHAENLFRFRHALIRDAAYRSLLRKARRKIHRSIAEALTMGAGESLNVPHDLIAQHYSVGEDHLAAISFWQKGVKDAIARSAHEEALGMLEAALADFRELRGPQAPGLELDLVLAKAMVLRSLKGYSAPEVEERLGEARRLCILAGDTRNRFHVEWGLFQCTIVKGDIAAAHRLATGLYAHAERHPEKPFVDAHLANGMAALNSGDFEGAMQFLKSGVAASELETDQPHFLTHGQNPGLFCLSYLARTQCFLGYLDQARASINRGLEISATRARDLGHIHSHVNALIHAVRVHHLCGDLKAERRLAYEATAFARRHHYAYYEAVGECHLGWVTGAEGSLSEGIDRMATGIAAAARTANQLGQLGFFLMLARLLRRAGRPREAWETLEAGVRLKTAGFAGWDAEIERVRGDILAFQERPDLPAAEAAYRVSMDIAWEQKARLLSFNAASSLARLLQRLGRREEGHDVLAFGLEQLPERSNMQRAQEAQRLLADLVVTTFH